MMLEGILLDHCTLCWRLSYLLQYIDINFCLRISLVVFQSNYDVTVYAVCPFEQKYKTHFKQERMLQALQYVS